jgi:magnesium and cobalt exporter, CNNM family
MSGSALTMAAVVVTLVCAAWAGLLALSEESPAVTRSEGSEGTETFTPHRTLHLARLTLLMLTAFAGSSVVVWWDKPLLPATGVAVVAGAFLYMLAEALPRAVALLAPDVASAAGPLGARTVAAFKPLAAIANWVERRLTALLPEPAEEHAAESFQRDLLLGVFSLRETTVAEVMTPRLDILGVEATADWNEVVDAVRRSEHARLPVYRDTLDDILGILYAKDLVAAVAGTNPRPDTWHALIRPAQFVPEGKPLTTQLRDFQRGRGHLAVVVDEYGGTSGLITLEDALEEVVGEIRDEYDVDEEPAVEQEGGDKFWVDGTVNLDELSALLGIAIEDEDVSTVGGFVYAELGHVPRPGEEFRFGGFRVVVEQVVRRRIRRVYFERLAAATPAEEVGP